MLQHKKQESTVLKVPQLDALSDYWSSGDHVKAVTATCVS